MKVSGPSGPKGVAGTKSKDKAKGKGDGAFARELSDAGEVSAPAGLVDNQPVAPVGALLALQQVPDATDGRSRGLTRDYGERMLDHLEAIRMGLLDGAVPKQQLQDLAQKLRADRKRSDDPKLNAVIEEIELRAEVEIAKLTRSKG